MAPCFSAEEPVRSSSVIVSRPETPASWILPQKYTLTLSAHPPSTAPSSHPQERGSAPKITWNCVQARFSHEDEKNKNE